mmetsp:Transcript_16901/g.51274  ORF Transcript_16901/g.51274 Transcript_16901/m.51274 type:complete len:111 (+) Transcript_16901:430-762(+)
MQAPAAPGTLQRCSGLSATHRQSLLGSPLTKKVRLSAQDARQFTYALSATVPEVARHRGTGASRTQSHVKPPTSQASLSTFAQAKLHAFQPNVVLSSPSKPHRVAAASAT